MAQELHTVDPRQFVGYGQAAIPDPRDEEVSATIDELITAGAPAVAGAIAGLDERIAQVLRAYAERMASAAVRRGERLVLLRALVAVVVGGLHAGRPDALVVTSVIEDAATRIGVDVQSLFGDASGIVGHPGSVELMRWLSRPVELRAIDQMGFTAEQQGDQDGFRYVSRW